MLLHLAIFLALFVYFKASFDFQFYSDISIMASAIIATIAYSYIEAYRRIFFSIPNYSENSINAFTVKFKNRKILWGATLFLAYILLSQVVIFGFSKKLFREIDSFKKERYSHWFGTPTDHFFQVAFIYLVPVIISIFVFRSIYKNQKKEQAEFPSDENRSPEHSDNHEGFYQDITRPALDPEEFFLPGELVGIHKGREILLKGRNYYVGESKQPYMSIEIAQQAIDRGDE